jgi:hypothetical protein
VGEADDAVARRLESGVAGAVALEGRVMAVEREAVEFDDESGGRPVGVGLVTKDEDVSGGWGKAVIVAEGQKAVLQRRSGPDDCAALCEESVDRTQAVASHSLLTYPLNRSQLEQVEPVRLLPGPLKLPEIHDFGEVKERPRNRRDRNPVASSPFIGMNPPYM